MAEQSCFIWQNNFLHKGGMLALMVAAMGFALLAAATHSMSAARGAPAEKIAAVPRTAERWIDSWAVSFLPTTVNGAVQATPTFNNQTFRLMVFSHLAGSQARVQFTNKFSDKPLTIGAARIALPQSDPAVRLRAGIDEKTDHPLTFNGQKSVTLAPGQEIWSDPAPLAIPQHTLVAISLFIPENIKPTGFHPTGLRTSYLSAEGDHTAEAMLPAPTPPAPPANAPARRGPRNAGTTDMVFFVSGLQVMAPAKTRVIVTFGDSITDGSASSTDAGAAWPDVLSKRLPKLPDGTPVSVINMGIGSNRFISADAAGPAGVKRFDEDVLARPNVTHLIVMEGINDISYEHVKPETLIEGYKSIIEKAHAKGIKVIACTLLPIQNSRKDTPENIATQQAVNSWIRESNAFDDVFDFEKVVQDPQNPLRIRANLTGDYVHPNNAGYKLLADSIDLKIFE